MIRAWAPGDGDIGWRASAGSTIRWRRQLVSASPVTLLIVTRRSSSSGEPGDRIYLFGFSRGAYTVRCLAGVIAFCGIPRHPLEAAGPAAEK